MVSRRRKVCAQVFQTPLRDQSVDRWQWMAPSHMISIKWLVALLLFPPIFLTATPLSSFTMSRTSLKLPSVHPSSALQVSQVRQVPSSHDKSSGFSASAQIIFTHAPAGPPRWSQGSKCLFCGVHVKVQVIKHNLHRGCVLKPR